MKIAVLLLNFGEPERPVEAEVIPFLERIFLMNGELEGRLGHDRAVARARELAAARAPGLIEEYEEIGGSPLHRQAEEQAVALEAELKRRGMDARCYAGMQFTEPSIQNAVERARADGCDTVVGLPIYPLCGTSTTVMSLGMMADAMQRIGWDVPRLEISGWHRHPEYTALRADGIREVLRASGESFDRGCRLVFSAHGIPLKYLEQGNRYDVYVQLLPSRVVGVNATNGTVLWEKPWPGQTAVIPTPLIHEDDIFVTSGYGVGCRLMTMNARGDNVEVVYNDVILVLRGLSLSVTAGEVVDSVIVGGGAATGLLAAGIVCVAEHGVSRHDCLTLPYAETVMVPVTDPLFTRTVALLIRPMPSAS